MNKVKTRCGFVAVLGAPNAGKSTLVNALVGQKVSIVTQKVQTTRIPVRGIAIRGDVQIVFVDTPGIFAPRRRLDRAMVKAAWGGAADADAIFVMADAPELSANPNGLAAGDTDRIIEGLKQAGRRAALVLNKIDAMRRDALLPLAARLQSSDVFDRTFMVSATKGDPSARLLLTQNRVISTNISCRQFVASDGVISSVDPWAKSPIGVQLICPPVFGCIMPFSG